MTDFAKMEQRIAADIVEERRRYWDPRYATKNARPWGRTLLRRKRERIAIAVRDTAEILYQTEGCEPLLVIYDLLHSAVLSGFIPNDLADPDVCLALATMSPPQVGTLPYTARVLARAARFARSPSLPCPWGIFSLSDWDVRMYAYGLIARNVQ